MSDVAKKSSSVSAVRPVLVLVAICMVAGALLGAVHEVTAPIAEANAQAKAREIYAELVPDAKEFVEVECAVDGCMFPAKGPFFTGAKGGVNGEFTGGELSVGIQVAYDQKTRYNIGTMP